MLLSATSARQRCMCRDAAAATGAMTRRVAVTSLSIRCCCCCCDVDVSYVLLTAVMCSTACLSSVAKDVAGVQPAVTDSSARRAMVKQCDVQYALQRQCRRTARSRSAHRRSGARSVRRSLPHSVPMLQLLLAVTACDWQCLRHCA